MNYFMLNWSGRSVDAEHMLVLQQVAQYLLSPRCDLVCANFIHTLCEGQVTLIKRGVFVSTGGTFFLGNLGEYNGLPHTVNFFIPRGKEGLPTLTEETVIIRQQFDIKTSQSIGYPDDVDVASVLGGQLRISAPNMQT